jgi:hypothetical protein
VTPTSADEILDVQLPAGDGHVGLQSGVAVDQCLSIVEAAKAARIASIMALGSEIQEWRLLPRP